MLPDTFVTYDPGYSRLLLYTSRRWAVAEIIPARIEEEIRVGNRNIRVTLKARANREYRSYSVQIQAGLIRGRLFTKNVPQSSAEVSPGFKDVLPDRINRLVGAHAKN